MAKKHFADDYLLLFRVVKMIVDGAIDFLDTFFSTSGAIVSYHKNEFSLVILHTPLDWIPTTWYYIHPWVIT
jgi:hypothetical protein